MTNVLSGANLTNGRQTKIITEEGQPLVRQDVLAAEAKAKKEGEKK